LPFFYILNTKNYFFGTALPSFLYFQDSLKYPINQYGLANVNKNIINQNPIVKIVKNTKNPENCDKSITLNSNINFYKNNIYFLLLADF